MVSTLALDNIALLVTNDPALGEGPLGLVRGAALVFEGDRVRPLIPRALPPTTASTSRGGA